MPQHLVLSPAPLFLVNGGTPPLFLTEAKWLLVESPFRFALVWARSFPTCLRPPKHQTKVQTVVKGFAQEETGSHPRIKSEGNLFGIML
jgi:hypothetical protein